MPPRATAITLHITRLLGSYARDRAAGGATERGRDACRDLSAGPRPLHVANAGEERPPRRRRETPPSRRGRSRELARIGVGGSARRRGDSQHVAARTVGPDVARISIWRVASACGRRCRAGRRGLAESGATGGPCGERGRGDGGCGSVSSERQLVATAAAECEREAVAGDRRGERLGRGDDAVGTLRRELWDVYQFADRDEATRRLAEFLREVATTTSTAPTWGSTG